MNNDLKAIISEFMVKLDKYLTDKSIDIGKQIIANTKLLAQIEDSKDKIEELKQKEEELSLERSQFQIEKDKFSDSIKQYGIKKHQLDDKARRIQTMLNE